MNLKGISNVVSNKLARQVLIGQKHSPKILFVAGVIGVATTVVLACRATLKVDEILEEAQKDIHQAKELLSSGHENYSELDYKRDITVVNIRTGATLVKLYG